MLNTPSALMYIIAHIVVVRASQGQPESVGVGFAAIATANCVNRLLVVVHCQIVLNLLPDGPQRRHQSSWDRMRNDSILKESNAKLIIESPTIMRMRMLLLSCFFFERDKLSNVEYNENTIMLVNAKARTTYNMNIVAPTRLETGMDISSGFDDDSPPVALASQETRPPGRRRASMCAVVKYERHRICAAHQARAHSRCGMEDIMTAAPFCSRLMLDRGSRAVRYIDLLDCENERRD